MPMFSGWRNLRFRTT